MNDKIPDEQNDGVPEKLRTVIGAALTGSVLSGAFFSWIAMPFDVHLIGVSLGTIVGLIAVFKPQIV